jgi:hypothetical protein
VITDTAVITMIRNSLNSPLGALAQYKAIGKANADIEAMYKVLTTFWSVVKAVFPDAWGKDPRKSRLMHSAGIEAMGVLMDRIYARLAGADENEAVVRRELEKVAPACRWTKGTWDDLGVAWNEIQNTPRDIKKLQDALVHAYSAGDARK